MSEARIIGIDPGGDGALVVIDTNMHVVDEMRFKKSTWESVADKIEDYKDGYFVLEEPHGVFSAGSSSSFKFGKSCGRLEGILLGLFVKYETVKPKAWQKEVWVSGSGKPKDRSLDTALSYGFPFTHNGLVDAYLIAVYGCKKKLLNAK